MSLSSSKPEGEGEGEQKSFPASAPEDSLNNPNPAAKTSNLQPYLDVPLESAFARSSETLSDLSIYSADNENERRTGRLLTLSPGGRLLSRSPAPAPKTWKQMLRQFWARNKGVTLVILAQFFGVMMNVTIILLEKGGTSGRGMHPFQILFARMTGTLFLSGIYQWWAKVEGAPFGSKEVRGLLIARGVGGFFGVYGIYYSLQYLPLSDATVITFLAPIVACWACSLLLHEPFTRKEQIAGIISFLGVVLIARPLSLFPHHSGMPPPIASGAGDVLPSTNTTIPANLEGPNHVTPAQRLTAVGVALTGVLGAASAYTTIRWIGKRAHPLISVSYFAAWANIVSVVALLAVPGIGFQLPANFRQWVYLIFLGICGFAMQFLLTAGLQHEKSSRATNMVYTQMLFALASDKLVWNHTPGTLSIAGSSLILGSALYVALYNNNKTKTTKEGYGRGGDGRSDEEVALEGDDDDDGRGPLRGLQEVQLRTLRV